MMAIVVYDLPLGLLLFLAFALLALTQAPHRRATGTTDLPSDRVMQLRLVAILSLAMALLLAVHHEGEGFGFLLWSGLISLAACAVSLVLAWCPRLLGPLSRLLQ